jgi:formate dehydrogenase iron-sulfur subunit
MTKQMGFFTDTSVCIGCKACEVACKEWNHVPEDGHRRRAVGRLQRCGYCVAACPFGVIQKREGDGRAWKCTLCYDRLKDDETPACAKACPTESIVYGELGDLRERADARLEVLQAAGEDSARLYLRDEDDGVRGGHAFFLLLDEPEVYGLPPDPVSTTRDLPQMWRAAAAAGGALVAGVALALVGR